METKLCRICGKLGQNYVHIFKTEGLKNKIETCLPIIVSPHSLLPDTICGECSENVDNFYSFIKNCLQNIIILEAQYDINESCLKTKRKHEKGCHTDLTLRKYDKKVQTDNCLDLILKENNEYIDDINKYNLPLHPRLQQLTEFGGGNNSKMLVDYEIESDTNSDNDDNNEGVVVMNNKLNKILNKQYFDDEENYLINEITQRKTLKRKNSDTGIEVSCPKIFKIDNTNRRKCKQPKKVEKLDWQDLEKLYEEQIVKEEPILEKTDNSILPQVCLLCDEQFSGPSMLTSHVFEAHGIDMAQIVSLSTETNDKNRRKLPNLLKIADLKRNDSFSEFQAKGIELMNSEIVLDEQLEQQEEPPTLFPTFVCPICPAVFTSRSDLFTHLRVKHQNQASLLCGLCLYKATSYLDLKNHSDNCLQQHQQTSRYLCDICKYADDNPKNVENHILVHDFLIDACKKQSKMFDPADYIELNGNCTGSLSPTTKQLNCSECGADQFDTFKEFSAHRRSQHSIFHCDLCNKFYGRNSHLWKHVNRLHKGHPSITCQLCYKTSASKYHLAQHFNKIHSTKCNSGSKKIDCDNDFMSQKFQAFDFQSVKQSFMRQELLQEQNAIPEDDFTVKQEPLYAPKAIDSSSELFTNIITNYTPPVNEGEFKCPKCSKGFHKKTLLKKHKKNCRPRLQKDLLTRCKSCARIFKDRQSLAKHLVNYHSEYACEICGQKVQSKCEIVSHIRFSHPGCQLFCKICGNILRSRNDLIEHTRDHLNSYVCQFCGDSLPSKIKLKMHILSLHRKILSLSCGICLKLFETQHVLRDHVRLVHREQLAPLTSCPVCGKNYGSKWKTYDHLNKSHGRIFKACKTCLEIFDNEQQLEQHTEAVHGQLAINSNVNVPNKNTTAVVVPELLPPSDSEDSNDEENEEDNYYNNKISLLEKRLLGKDEIKNKMKPASKKKKEFNKEDIVDSPNPLQNSSKRTVYVNSNDPSFCEICHKTWPAKKHLWQHYIRCHKSVAATVCGICLKTNDSYKTLQQHLRETHPTLLHGQGFGSNFICRICGRYHNASSKLRLHMAIHENFDWSLLEEKEIKQETNGYCENKQDDINYESLIEQVECSSSDSDDDDDDKQSSSKSSSDEDEDADNDNDNDEDDESETCESEQSMDQTEIQNMLHNEKDSENKEYTSSEDTNESYAAKTESEESQESKISSTHTNSNTNSLFHCKSEELDSAIQSIKYEYLTKNEIDISDDYCSDLQAPALNENEIESAVGSIL